MSFPPLNMRSGTWWGPSLWKARMLQTTLLMAWALMYLNVKGRSISCMCRGQGSQTDATVGGGGESVSGAGS